MWVQQKTGILPIRLTDKIPWPRGQGLLQKRELSTLKMANYFFSRSICTLWLLFALNAWATTDSANLDKDLGRIVSATYSGIAKSANSSTDYATVLAQAERAYTAQDYAGALHILAAHRALDVARVGDADLHLSARLALQLYGHPLVEVLLAEARQQADRLSEATLLLELARFYAANERWENVIQLFTDDAIFEQLSKNDLGEAYVLWGTALQKQKKHREAIRIYEKVASDSRHFRIAQLNLASAFLRQEWWTDAHAAIHAALKENSKKRDELDYRLFTMLGYSQIQFGFYRDARESFRNVAVSSGYAQRALLGLGIAALHQQDFIGALNAFDKLRALPKQDMSATEAYLLSAFTLRQLEQFDAATGRYQEAIDYYQTLSSQIAAQLESNNGAAIHFLRAEHNTDKTLVNNARKIALLDGLSKSVAGNDSAGIGILRSKLNNTSAQRTRDLLREEKTAIDSYLSQSRFGLASLYDHK